MKTYRVVYLPTGRAERDKNGDPIVIQANSERGAKAKATRLYGYFNWDLCAVIED